MAQTINTNIPALTARRNLSGSQLNMATAMQRLSSGLRINSAKDDAAGLAIAERMNSQVRGMNVAIRNANDGISLAQTAEGGLNEIGSMLQRMRELAVQSMNGTNSTSDRANLNVEYVALANEIERITATTKFNDKVVLQDASAFSFQVGANTTADDKIAISGASTLAMTGMSNVVTSAGENSGIAASISTVATATATLGNLDSAIGAVTTARAQFGAVQSRFQSAINNLQISVENQAAARGRIVDADFAVETAALTRAQILQQAGNAMVAQANAAPQSVLQLLG